MMAELLKTGAVLSVSFTALYLIVLLIVWAGQERFIFQARPLPQDYAFSFDADFEETTVLTADGVALHALFFRAAPTARGAVLYFHGNRGNLSRWGKLHRPFTQRGYDVLMIDYRGYGKSTGTPTEAGLYQDADAALQWLLQHYSLEDIIFYGRSLGSGVAAYLATKYLPRALVLETPYDALPNVIRHQALLPLPGFIFRHHFPTCRYLPEVNCPVHLFAGSRDQLIPLGLSSRLKPLLTDPARFYLIEGAGHHNILAFEAYHFQLDRLLLP